MEDLRYFARDIVPIQSVGHASGLPSFLAVRRYHGAESSFSSGKSKKPNQKKAQKQARKRQRHH